MSASRGFTLVELVVAIAISSIVVVFAAMFIGAPLGAYEAHSRRAALVADTSGAWPRMESDLRRALPNSLRRRRNGNFVVIEMLAVLDVARYTTPPSAAQFNTAGVYRGDPTSPRFLWVNSLGTPNADPYTVPGLLAPIGTFVHVPNAVLNTDQITVTPAPVFAGDSPRHRIYFLEGPVTYLCDEGQGTLRRYANYTVAANQTARDTPAELTGAGAVGTLVTQGLTSCGFEVSALSGTQSQTAAVRLTTTRKGDVVTLLHSSQAEFAP